MLYHNPACQARFFPLQAARSNPGLWLWLHVCTLSRWERRIRPRWHLVKQNILNITGWKVAVYTDLKKLKRLVVLYLAEFWVAKDIAGVSFHPVDANLQPIKWSQVEMIQRFLLDNQFPHRAKWPSFVLWSNMWSGQSVFNSQYSFLLRAEQF